ncbi:WhiB family transcriptional regulator [Rhodococcus zopfii]|uniref:WhiB family transcriptional regulator n=1 Tax=Rhodococcus zopfii TaxID=43772 RepID=UPI00352813BB
MTRRRNPREPHVPDPIAGLIDPRLIGARCAGRAPLFDTELPDELPEHRSARLTWATRECTRCPVQTACRTAVTELDSATGVWAGHLTDPAGTPGRPQKKVS